MNQFIFRALRAADHDQWLPLWDSNNLGHRDEAVTQETWRRILAEDEPVYGVCAEQNGDLLGITHYILHPTTGHLRPVCYVQDVYVRADQRRRGIARRLVEHVIRTGTQEQWARIYWLTPNDNESAKALYKNLGIKLDFAFYVLPVS